MNSTRFSSSKRSTVSNKVHIHTLNACYKYCNTSNNGGDKAIETPECLFNMKCLLQTI